MKTLLRVLPLLVLYPFLLAAEPARPNILFCLADDWMWPHASIAGDKVLRTPTFDRVAREGVLFKNAFVAAPSCTPSRAAILTGQWPFRLEIGAHLYGTLPAKYDVYPDLLEKSGYHVGLTRKGWAPGGVTEGGRTRNPAGPNYKDFDAFLAARPQGKPFCFWFGSHDPHRPYDWESGVKSGLKLEDVFVPPYLPDCETVRKDICDYYWKIQRYDREVGQLLATLEKIGELENTVVVMAGDNGWPFPRSKATCYETGTHVPLAIRWPAKFKGNRVVDDFASLADLAPTFCELGGVTPPQMMSARSLLNVLSSDKSGQVDPARDHVLTCMERHAWGRPREVAPVSVPAGGGFNGYPMRALRTDKFHYIRNFKPDRWPACDPNGYEVPGAQPFTYEKLTAKTFTAFADCDASPSKAWMLLHRDEPAVKPLYQLAFEKHPARELYDLQKDPYQMKNVAEDPAYAEAVKTLDAQLMAELKATADPRALGAGDEFDKYPIYGRK
ncbi:MAG TPA: sulfatase [Planctomycetota bacterium]|jgi:uncharacterized sulfatase